MLYTHITADYTKHSSTTQWNWLLLCVEIVPKCNMTYVGTIVLSDLYSLTNYMEQSPSWEANRFSASQEIPHILRNLNVHYRIHNSRPSVPILATATQPMPRPHPTS